LTLWLFLGLCWFLVLAGWCACAAVSLKGTEYGDREFSVTLTDEETAVACVVTVEAMYASRRGKDLSGLRDHEVVRFARTWGVFQLINYRRMLERLGAYLADSYNTVPPTWLHQPATLARTDSPQDSDYRPARRSPKDTNDSSTPFPSLQQWRYPPSQIANTPQKALASLSGPSCTARTKRRPAGATADGNSNWLQKQGDQAWAHKRT
jgi:hypothetical protein